jgi:hypothetical protein
VQERRQRWYVMLGERTQPLGPFHSQKAADKAAKEAGLDGYKLDYRHDGQAFERTWARRFQQDTG